MDEGKLSELFGQAVPDPPPPTFGVPEVVAESNRVRIRNRNALLGGSVLGLALLTGAGVLGVALWKGTDARDTNTAGSAAAPGVVDSTGNGKIGQNEVPNEGAPQLPKAADGGSKDHSLSAESPKQGGTSSGNAGPSGPGSTLNGCGQADRELAAALAGELPAAAHSPNPADAVPAIASCPADGRGAGFVFNENGLTGRISVILLSGPTGDVGIPPSPPPGTAVADAFTASNRKVVLLSTPSSDPPPFAADLQDIAYRVAGKLSG